MGRPVTAPSTGLRRMTLTSELARPTPPVKGLFPIYLVLSRDRLIVYRVLGLCNNVSALAANGTIGQSGTQPFLSII